MYFVRTAWVSAKARHPGRARSSRAIGFARGRGNCHRPCIVSGSVNEAFVSEVPHALQTPIVPGRLAGAPLRPNAHKAGPTVKQESYTMSTQSTVGDATSPKIVSTQRPPTPPDPDYLLTMKPASATPSTPAHLIRAVRGRGGHRPLPAHAHRDVPDDWTNDLPLPQQSAILPSTRTLRGGGAL